MWKFSQFCDILLSEVRWERFSKRANPTIMEITVMKKIVISGSISLSDKMKNIANQLTDMGYMVVIPEEVEWDNIPQNKYDEYKKELSMQYFNEIAKEDTYAVLAVNDVKRGIENYIGASTFAEIAIAFFFGKKIFALNDIYEPYKDELSAWGVIPLNGKLSDIK